MTEFVLARIAQLHTRRIVSEALFWTHLLVIIAGVLMGLVLPLWAVIALVLLHRAHIRLLGGCALSQIQQQFGGLGATENFLDNASRRLLGLSLSDRQTRLVDYSFGLTSVAFAGVNQFVGFSAAVITIVVYLTSIGLILSFKLRSKNFCKKTCNDSQKLPLFSAVPLWLIGAIYFVLISVLAILSPLNLFLNNLLLALVTAGIVTSIALVFTQTHILKHICKLCMTCHAISVTVGGLIILVL